MEQKEPNAIAWVARTYGGERFRFRMTISENARGAVELLSGTTRPELGWYSARYGVKLPGLVVLVRITPERVTTVRTVIEPAR